MNIPIFQFFLLFLLSFISPLLLAQNNIMPKDIQAALLPKKILPGIPFDALFEAGFCRLPPAGLNIPDAIQKNSHEFFSNGKFIKFFPSTLPLIDYANIQVVQLGKIWWSIPYGSNKNLRIPALNAGQQFSFSEDNTYTLTMEWPGIKINNLMEAIFSYRSGWRMVTESEAGSIALAGPDYNVLEEAGASIILFKDIDSGLTKMVYRCQPR